MAGVSASRCSHSARIAGCRPRQIRTTTVAPLCKARALTYLMIPAGVKGIIVDRLTAVAVTPSGSATHDLIVGHFNLLPGGRRRLGPISRLQSGDLPSNATWPSHTHPADVSFSSTRPRNVPYSALRSQR